MSYTKQTWADAPATSSPLSAARLGHIEDGIFNTDAAAAAAASAASSAGTAASSAASVAGSAATAAATASSDAAAAATAAASKIPKGLSIWSAEVGSTPGSFIGLKMDYAPSGTDPEPMMFSSKRSSADQRAFWVNEAGTARSAAVQDEPALKLFGPNANLSYTGDIIAFLKAYGTQTPIFSMNMGGQPKIGTGATVAGFGIILTSAASVPTGLPIGTLIGRRP